MNKTVWQWPAARRVASCWGCHKPSLATAGQFNTRYAPFSLALLPICAGNPAPGGAAIRRPLSTARLVRCVLPNSQPPHIACAPVALSCSILPCSTPMPSVDNNVGKDQRFHGNEKKLRHTPSCPRRRASRGEVLG